MATKYGGYMGKVLKVDLSTRAISEYPWTDQERELYLGGKTMAAKIIDDNISGPIDPYSEKNLLVFTTGPMTGSGAPSSSRWNVSSISPQTGLLTSSNCGGSFGYHLKKAGYDALIVVGKSVSPIWLEVTDAKVEFHDATDLWGTTTTDAQEKMGGKLMGKAVIGPAGENLVRYAGVFSQDRTAGRGGVGAVMGSKKLKGIAVGGRLSVVSKDPKKTKQLNTKWIDFLRKHPITGDILPKLGTANLVRRMQRRDILATKNFSTGEWGNYEQISGETMAEKYLVKNEGCITCPIRCSRVVEVHGKCVKGPELETLVLLGSNLLNGDLTKIFEWNYELDEMGMDTISFAGSIAFAMELEEKGLWKSGLQFGHVDNITQAIHDTAHRVGIGDVLAEGSKRMSEQFGGKEFAIHSKGMELAAYEPRGAVGQGLGYAVSNRGACHLNAGYMVFMEGLGLGMNGVTPWSKASLTIMMQNLMEAVSSNGNCLFTSYAMIPGFLLDDNKSVISGSTNSILAIGGPFVMILNLFQGWLAPIHLFLLPHTKALQTLTGMKMNFGKFLQTGERGYNLERMINIKLGFKPEQDTLASRLTKESQTTGHKLGPVPLAKLVSQFYSKRGWDKNGKPKPGTLKKLKLS
ncbi:MAG: aldehyde ferredoxin oxidoreductase family protein [Solirubrobacterales bacterium]